MPGHRTAAPSDEAGAAGLARAFRRKCDGLLPRGCCAEELRCAVWQLLSHVLARSFAGSLDGTQLCAAIGSGFSNDPNVDDETRTPVRCAAQGDETPAEIEWVGRYGPKPGPRRYGRREERVRQLLLSPACCAVLASLAFDRVGASETLSEVAHVLFALLSACVTFGLSKVSAALARDAEQGKLVRCWGLSCPAGVTAKAIGGIAGLLALRGAEAMTALLNYGRSLTSSGSAAIQSFGQIAPLSVTAWGRNSEAEKWHLAPRPLLVRDGSVRLGSTDDTDSSDAAGHSSLPWSSWTSTPKRIFEELLAQVSGFAEPGVRWSKMAQDLMEDDNDETFTAQVVEQLPEWQPRRGYFSKVALASVGGRHCVVQLFVCPLRRGTSSLESSCELVAEAIAACRHSDGRTYRMLLPRELAMSWVEQAAAADASSIGVHHVLDQQAPGQHVLCDEPNALPRCIETSEGASGFVKMPINLLGSQDLPGLPQNRKPNVQCRVEMVVGVLFVDAPREPTVDYNAWNQWKIKVDEAAATRSKPAAELPRSRSHVATQLSTMTYMVNVDDDLRLRETALDVSRKQRVDAIKLRLDELVEETMDLTDNWNETEEDEEARRARLRSERNCVQLLAREPEGVHRYAKVTVRCNAIWSDVTTGGAVEVEATYRTRHESAWPDDHYLTQRGRLRFTLDPPAPGLLSHEGTTELQEIKVPLVYNEDALMDMSAAASDPLQFNVYIDSAEIVNGCDGAETKLGLQYTAVFLTTPVHPMPVAAEPKAAGEHLLEQWTPFKHSVPFCRTCGRIASDNNCGTLWSECLHAHGLPQRLGAQPGVCQEMSAASELAAAFAVRRLRTMDTARAPMRRTKTAAQLKEQQAAAQTEAKRRRQNWNPLQWLDKVNENARISELDRVLNKLAEMRLPWAGTAYSESVWQQLSLGRKDPLYFLRATINRMAEDGVTYEPPEDHFKEVKSSTSTADARHHGDDKSQVRSGYTTRRPVEFSETALVLEQKCTNKTTDNSRATWLEFRAAVRKYTNVCSAELSDDELREVYYMAADEDGTIGRSDLAEMLAMTDAATAFAKTQQSLRWHSDTEPSADAFRTHEHASPASGKESLDRLDAASRHLYLRYCFHVGALTHHEYNVAIERLNNIQDQLDPNLLEESCSAATMAETKLPGVLSRLPRTSKATRFGTAGAARRDLAGEWKQEMFKLTARKYWKPDPRLAVQQLNLALTHSGGDCDTRGWNGQTVLMSCVQNSFLEGALFLLHKGANRLIQNNRGWSALMLAAKHGHAEMCVALLTAAIPVENTKKHQDSTRQRLLDQTNSSGDTALDIAVVNDMGACADLLAAYGAVVPRALQEAAARQARSGGWLHLAAASAAAGESSSEATATAAEIEQIVQRSSLAALEEGRSIQLARQTDLARDLYGMKQPSGKILPTVAQQSWGPSMAEKVEHEVRTKVFERDAEWVEISGHAAPRAMHRRILVNQNRRVVSLWGKTTSSQSRPQGQREKERARDIERRDTEFERTSQRGKARLNQERETTDLRDIGDSFGKQGTPTAAAQQATSARRVKADTRSEERQTRAKRDTRETKAPADELTYRQEQTCVPMNVQTEWSIHRAGAHTSRSDKKTLKIPSLREQLRLHGVVSMPELMTSTTQDEDAPIPSKVTDRHTHTQQRREMQIEKPVNRETQPRPRERVRVPSMREQMAALAQ